MPALRIFSYLPNPRVAKATIASRLNGVDVELRGGKPGELADWLWDFDAHPLTDAEREDATTLRTARKGFRGGIHKTDAFLRAHPFGTVPAAFSGDGGTGIFESNSILRAVGRLGQEQVALYGADAFAAARIDSFLDAGLVFGLEAQRYLFAFADPEELGRTHRQMNAAFETYMGAIDAALANTAHIAEDTLTLADICFACEITLFALERHESKRLAAVGAEPLFGTRTPARWPRAHAHFLRLLAEPAFAPDLGPYYEHMTLAKVFG